MISMSEGDRKPDALERLGEFREPEDKSGFPHRVVLYFFQYLWKGEEPWGPYL